MEAFHQVHSWVFFSVADQFLNRIIAWLLIQWQSTIDHGVKSHSKMKIRIANLNRMEFRTKLDVGIPMVSVFPSFELNIKPLLPWELASSNLRRSLTGR